MGDFFADNDDLQWTFEHGVDWATLFEHTQLLEGDDAEFATWEEARDFWREIAGMIGQFAADEIAPHAAEIDEQPMRIVDGRVVMAPRLVTIFEGLKQLEIHGMCLPRQLGGMNCPLMLYFLSAELIARGDVSVMTHHSFHGGMAMAMLTYSLLEGTTEFDVATRSLVSTRFQAEIAEIAAGEAWGCMDITEPDAGSDMGALRARGEQDEDGAWFVTGQKIFVTSGNGKYHFVIARTEEASGDLGLDGLSLFLVNTYDDVDGERVDRATVERLEEKLGHHGSPTVAVSFERAPARLVGRRGEGFRMMLLLMNNARIAVGFESLGLCEAAYRMAKDYAAQRPSMGKTIDRHEILADYLQQMDADIRGLRALAVRAAFNEEVAHRLRMRRDFLCEPGSAEWTALDEESNRRTWRSRLTTPLVKFLAAEKAVEIARRALQIHGGVGYTKEYGAEKLLRDSLVLPIYEGTSQIQALMATKDALLFITKNPGGFFSAWADAQRQAAIGGDAAQRGVARLRATAQAAQVALMRRILRGKLKGQGIGHWKAALADWDTRTDFAPALLHAERLCRMLADAAVADALWSQVRKDDSRRWILERHLETALPRSRYLLDCIKTTGDRLLAELAAGEATA
jgi:alkylation response protein AidB-like acyl-CoA dehydrogenase